MLVLVKSCQNEEFRKVIAGWDSHHVIPHSAPVMRPQLPLRPGFYSVRSRGYEYKQSDSIYVVARYEVQHSAYTKKPARLRSINHAMLALYVDMPPHLNH